MQKTDDRRNTGFLAGKCLRAGLPMAAALTLAAFAAAGPARPDTVNCARADISAEYAICNSESLQDLDVKLDTAYRKQAAAIGNKPGLQKMEREQVKWQRERDKCKADMTCLALRYSERLLDLDNGTPEKPSSLLGFVGQ